MTNKKPFAEYSVESYDDFQDRYLTIQKNRHFKQAVYRGQSESAWQLIPSIFRDAPNTGSISFDWIKERIKEEYQNVHYFAKRADEIGFDLPGQLFSLLNTYKLDDANFYGWYKTQTENYVEIITLAQHHGARTRFLDFTFNPYVALYFAAEGVIKELSKSIEKDEVPNKHFSLWMIDRLYLFYPGCNLKHFEVPTARNKYLYAQKGLFLRPPLPSNTSLDKTDLDIKEVAIKNCHEIAKTAPGFTNIWPVIFKFNFPFKLAP